MLRESLRQITNDAAEYHEILNVLLLGRYKRTQPKNMAELAMEFPDLRLSYMTVHRSKGLESDYVVVLDLCSGKYGFPSEIADDPLLELVLAARERHSNAEERRLLYVAITRAKCGVYLLADGELPFTFVKELLLDGYDVTSFGRLPESDVACPRCVVDGRLERRQNSQDQSVFYGCSHYPYCEYKQPTCSHCETGLVVKVESTFRCRDCGQSFEDCPDCEGWLHTKYGKYGFFLGCSTWPSCDNTRYIDRKRQ